MFPQFGLCNCQTKLKITRKFHYSRRPKRKWELKLQQRGMPPEGKCQIKNIVYQATLTQEAGKIETYVGLTGQTFKNRWDGHKKAFKHEIYSDTTLSQHVWKLKKQGTNYSVKWKVISRASPFSAVSEKCNLCTEEKYFIIYHPNLGSLNYRNELYNHCRHKSSLLLDKT